MVGAGGGAPTPSSGAGHGRPLDGVEDEIVPQDGAAAGVGRGRGGPGTRTTGAGRGRGNGIALAALGSSSDSQSLASTGCSRTEGLATGLVKKRFKNLGKCFSICS